MSLDIAFLEAMFRFAILSLPDPRIGATFYPCRLDADHHIPHTGYDHNKTYSIYENGFSLSWPWSGASTLT